MYQFNQFCWSDFRPSSYPASSYGPVPHHIGFIGANHFIGPSGLIGHHPNHIPGAPLNPSNVHNMNMPLRHPPQPMAAGLSGLNPMSSSLQPQPQPFQQLSQFVNNTNFSGQQNPPFSSCQQLYQQQVVSLFS